MFFKILSTPMSIKGKFYKGVYRSEPIPWNDVNERFMELWNKYQQYLSSPNRGITNELMLSELKELATLSSVFSKTDFEVIYASERPICPLAAEYYGIDVAGFGGYSMVGENFFIDSPSLSEHIYNLYDIINAFFRNKLNENGLFSRIEDARSLLTVFEDLKKLSTSSIEDEDWKILHVFRIK